MRLHPALAGVVLALASALSACGAAHNRAVSAEGRKACLERMAQMEPGTPLEHKRANFRSCLKTIEPELARLHQAGQAQLQQVQQQRASQAAAQQASWATASERLTHCRLYQQQIGAAERARLQAMAPIISSSREFGADSRQAQSAQAVYQRQVEALEQLIPMRMRHGQPLIPDAVQTFVRCDPRELAAADNP